MIINSTRRYFLESGWLNLLDWVGILFAYTAYTYLGLLIASIPTLYEDPYFGLAAHRKGSWMEVNSQKDFQTYLAFTAFLLCFKALKFSKNIPIVSYIGSTFSAAVFDILAFSIIMIALFGAFGSWFNIMLATNVRDYGTFWSSVGIVSIDGLLGNMESTPITQTAPNLGPIMYALYLTIVVFVGFTILISIITDRYEEVKEVPVKAGFFVRNYRRVAQMADQILPSSEGANDLPGGHPGSSIEDEPGDSPEDLPHPQGGRAMIKSLAAKVDQQNALLQQLMEQFGNPASPDANQAVLSRGRVTNAETTRNGTVTSRSPPAVGSPRAPGGASRDSPPGPASPLGGVKLI